MIRVSRRWILRLAALSLAGGLAFLARPLHHLFRVAWQERARDEPLPEGMLDDASRMSATPVGELVRINDQSDLIEAFARARDETLSVAVSGARLSMGGQALVADGLVLDMTGYGVVRYKPDREVVVAGAGASWLDVLEELDRHGRSPTIAPSMADVTVGGSLSVNAYGAQVGRPPVAAGVVELLVMLVDGALWRCSRIENVELFSAVLGGYGLFAVIVEATLATVPNRACQLESRLVPAAGIGPLLQELAADTAVEAATASLAVLPGQPFDRAIVRLARSVEGSAPSLRRAGGGWLHRTALEGAVGDDYGKWLNWQIDSLVAPVLEPGRLSRNSLFNHTIGGRLMTGGETSNLVLTVFVPAEELAAWLNQAGLIMAGYESDLLEIDVHYLAADTDTLLRYAARDLCAVRMLFNESRRPSGEYRIRELSMALIARAVALGGSFFLPFRRHASQRQFYSVYGNLARFARLKLRYDPEVRLQSAFYRVYLQHDVE